MYVSNNRTRIALKIPLLMDITQDKGELSGVPDQEKILNEVKYSLDKLAKDKSLIDGFHHLYTTFDAHYSALNTLPTVEGTRWLITKNIYEYFMDILPPRLYRLGYIVPEPVTSNDEGKIIYSYYYCKNGQYWHEYTAIS